MKEKDKEKADKEDTSQATKKWTEDVSKNAFCLNSRPTCAQGVVKCITEEDQLSASPACVQNGKKINSEVRCAQPGSVNEKALCLPPILVTVAHSPSSLWRGYCSML